ncbi:MAG: BlaI/MecI/CopY family transcriptional regulator [Steroidobacteraceae bacterium]
MPHHITDLGDLEREVLALVWKNGSVSADSVQKQLRRALKESTVRTVLKRLEGKGYLSHTLESRTFIYKARESRAAAAARAVKSIADRFCHGSLEEVLVGIVDARLLDRRELERLAEKIANAKGARRS